MGRYSTRPRLKGFNYVGRHRYFITICSYRTRPLFDDSNTVTLCLKILKETSSEKKFKVWAYCFMPDHLHLLVEGDADNADLKQYISLFKQISGYEYGQCAGERSVDEKPKLWQPSFYDHVLRKEEDLVIVARYIFNNPVRKGIVDHYSAYSYSGSLALNGVLR